MFDVVQQTIPLVNEQYSLELSETHLSILTLILEKLILKNRSGSRKQQLFIVTNSAENKVGYFVERLKAYFNVNVLGVVNINELHKLQGQEYDLIITFTNKISSYLEYYQLDCIKVNFNLTEEDFDLLRACGLSHLRNKIPAQAFKADIEGLSGKELLSLLQTKYVDYFV